MELIKVEEDTLEQIRREAYQAASEVCEAAKLRAGDLFVVGCSPSEVLGEKIGTHSSLDAAGALVAGIRQALQERGIWREQIWFILMFEAWLENEYRGF